MMETFQSGISLSICLHNGTTIVVGPASDIYDVVSIRHQPEYLPSRG